MACSSPSDLRLPPALRVFKHLELRYFVSKVPTPTLGPFHAALASCLLKPRTSTTLKLRFPFTSRPQHTPRLSFLAPQHLPEPLTLLFTPSLERASDQVCLPNQKSRTQGLATLSAMSAKKSLKRSLSTPNTLGLLPSELSSHTVIEPSFPMTLSTPALGYKTHPRPRNRAPAASSHPMSRTPLRSPCRLSRGGAFLCSPGLSGLSDPPDSMPTEKLLPSPSSLPSLAPTTLSSTRYLNLRAFPHQASASPHVSTRRRPV